MPDVTVTNSTVIIALSSINQLHLLYELYNEVFITYEVKEELLNGINKPGSDVDKYEWIKTINIKDRSKISKLLNQLDIGEASTILLAEEINADLVLMDDFWGRKVAKEKNLKITGTIGVLIKAKNKGLFTDLKKILDDLIQSGFWINKDLYEYIITEFHTKD
ncbi:MAG: DUF3368 domain-containing protein [Candidatus Kapabacteria bacterium]|nr:DUF3368 domain-containing protein [Candidatus Kapabacteria bacterium]